MKKSPNNRLSPHLPILLLTARPGAGKSEIIKYLSGLDAKTRSENYHIGKMKIIDDFPFLWRWFEEDHLLTQMHKERLFTDEEGYFKHHYQWDLLIHLINLEYKKFLRDTEDAGKYTVIIEFSRGKQHGGYARALPILSDAIVEKLSILYVNISWEESLRKNRRRYNPEKPDSILEHGMPDKKLEFMYSGCDFKEITIKDDEFCEIKGMKTPYAIFQNEDDVTTEYKPELGIRLKQCLEILLKNRINS